MMPMPANSPMPPPAGGAAPEPTNIKAKILQVLGELERIAQEGGLDFSDIVEEFVGKGEAEGAMPPPPPMM